MNRTALLVALSALPLVTGCATSVIPTSYLVHANVPYSDVSAVGGVNVLWTDRTVSMSPYTNIAVKEFATDKAEGAGPDIRRRDFGMKMRDLIIAGLKTHGKTAVSDEKSITGKGPYLAVYGNVAQLNPGKLQLRRWIGFGAGRAVVDAEVKVFLVDGDRRVLCAEFTSTHMKSMALLGGENIAFLNECVANLARNISAFIATHRNR